MTANEHRRDIINVQDVPTRKVHSGPRFEAALGDIDSALGISQLGATLGDGESNG